MRYQMKQKLLSWGDDFYVRDEQGNDVYFVDGKAISFGDQLSSRDMAGNELAFIKHKVFSIGRTYEIHRDGEDDVLILASAVVIDESCHPDDEGRR